MSLKKMAFWLGVVVGAGIGYAIGISLPEEKQQQLKEELRKRGEEVVTKAKDLGEQQAQDLVEEVRRRAAEWIEQAGERIPYTRTSNNGHA